jgi:hypothetical protein
MKMKIGLMTLLVCLAISVAQAQTALDKIVATKALQNGWQQSGEPKTYDKDNVFDLIDGEAELYFPYGFQRVAAINYARGGDANSEMAAEIYEMGSVLDAFGVYSNYRDTKSKLLDIGTEGYGGSGQIMFYQDKYFVKLRAQKMNAKPEDVSACAKEISAALPRNKKQPVELALIEIPEIIPQTVRYIAQSVLGYEFFSRGLLAQVKSGEKPARVFVVMPKEGETAETILAAYEKYLVENGATPQKAEPKTMAVMDPLHKGTVVKIAGKNIVGATEFDNPELAAPFIKELEQKSAK